MVVRSEIFDYIEGDSMLEDKPFNKIVQAGEMCAYKHLGFWKCMDTIRDHRILEDLWKNKTAPWKVWTD